MTSYTDNQLIELFLPIINSGLTALGYTDIIVQKLYQPTMQGVNNGATVYFTKVHDKRYGFLGRTDTYDEINNNFTHTESQWYESTFQVNALVIQSPQNISYTASDLLNSVASIMQSDSTINTLNAAGVGILRITDLTNPHFIDDRDQYEANPSFDFTLTYTRDIITTVPVVTQPVEYIVVPI